MRTDLISRSAAIDVLQELVDMETCGNTMSNIGFGLSMAIGRLISAPAVDAVPVVRCKDCLYAAPTYGNNYIRCAIWGEDIKNDKYCFCGKRRMVKADG